MLRFMNTGTEATMGAIQRPGVHRQGQIVNRGGFTAPSASLVKAGSGGPR
jgi:glutamate-1-semialdehyde aminotransferase